MSRAVLLPTAGDPFRSHIWSKSWNKFVKHHVDKLYVIVNSRAREDIVNYTADIYRSLGAEVEVYYANMGHKFLLQKLIEQCKEDLVLLLEDDFYILEESRIAQLFTMIESGVVDAIGSPRGCCSQEIITRTATKYNLSGFEASCPNFWPCLFLGKRDDLLRIREKNYGGKIHPAGVYIPEIDWTPTTDEAEDDFAWASLQLRALGIKIKVEDQCNWIDVLYRNMQTPPWIHTGAGSSSFNNHLICSDGYAVGSSKQQQVQYMVLPDEGLLFVRETTQAIWEIIRDYFPIPENSPLSYFNNEYKDALNNARDKIITTSGKKMREEIIGQQREWYEKILTPILL